MPNDYTCQVCDWFNNIRIEGDPPTGYVRKYLETNIAMFIECPICGLPVVVTKEHGLNRLDDPTYNMLVKQIQIIWPNAIPNTRVQHSEDHLFIHVEIRQ